VQEVLERLATLGAHEVRELDGAIERVVFPMPKGLHTLATTKAPRSVPDPEASAAVQLTDAKS
jgi:hypothetical protein